MITCVKQVQVGVGSVSPHQPIFESFIPPTDEALSSANEGLFKV